MSPSRDELSADQVLAFLGEQEQAKASAPAQQELVQAYREAAAVLAAIDEPEQLRPIDAADIPGDAVKILGDDLIHPSGMTFEGKVMLAPEIRRETIRELATSGRIGEALDANPDERTGPIQEQLERYLKGSAPPLEEQSLAELEATHQVVVWLGDAIEGAPSEQEVADRGAYLRLLAPFELIAGDDVFRGRKRELDELRSYVGVLPPESLRRRLKDIAFKWVVPERQPALSISGLGGVGKSALVARFMLEHTRIDEGARVPFAYLDFNRADLDVGDPLGLCAEMIRQVDCQFPEGDKFDALRRFADDPAHQSVSVSAESQLASAQSLLADLLGAMATMLGPRPYVVVLDTFEDVQYRGEARAFPLWGLLDELQERAPFLRVVISGRAPVESLRLAGRTPHSVVLGDLDTEAAIAFLEAQGVSDRQLAEQLVRSFGGVPLTLKLVASLAAKNAEELAAISPDGRRGGIFVSMSDEVVQGQLYGRILDHIRDEQVRRLAHPGLVLRRITPEIILEVLNEPCELGLTALGEAEELFEELQRETSLVAMDDLDGSLVHRSDLRRVMLKLLIQSEPDRVHWIRVAAVGFYERQPGRRGKAEEMYHRLHLGQSVDEKDLADPEVRSSIQSAIVELPTEVQLRLSTLGFQVSDEVRAEATREQQEASLTAQIEELLSYGERSEGEAVRLLTEAALNLDRPTPLLRSAARVALQQGDVAAGRARIERGLEQSVPAGRTDLTLGLLQERAWLERDGADPERAENMQQLGDYASRRRDRNALLQHRLQSLPPGKDERDRTLSILADLLDQMDPTEMWGLVPALHPAVSAAVRTGRKGVLTRLQELVFAEESPFRYAVFPDDLAQAGLETLLLPGDAGEFGKAFVRLTELWPYRILFVQPPFGRRGEQLSEFLA
jgi:hypothetical protein